MIVVGYVDSDETVSPFPRSSLRVAEMFTRQRLVASSVLNCQKIVFGSRLQYHS